MKILLKAVLQSPIPGAVAVMLAAGLWNTVLADTPVEIVPEPVIRSIILETEQPEVARRSGSRISLHDLQGRLEAIPPEDLPGVLSDPERVASLLNDTLMVHWLADRARADGLLEDPKMQARLVWRIADLLAGEYRRRTLGKLEFDDYTEQARELYIANKSHFETPEQVDFTHLLVFPSESGTADQARARAQELLDRARSGEDLGDLALTHSDDPSVGENKGRFSSVSSSDLDPQFAEGLAGLDAGDTGLIESSYGWHVVHLHAREASRPMAFEEVADRLRARARANHRDTLLNRFLGEFYEQPLELQPGAAQEIIDRFGSGL